jgi:hypothetical protein
MTSPDAQQIRQARILVDRLARLSADSIWAHRASGLRASMDKSLARLESGEAVDAAEFDRLLSLGYEMLVRAAEEIPVVVKSK